MKLFLGWKKPAIIQGKRQQSLLGFAMKYTGLHSQPKDSSDVRAMRALVRKGLLAYYPATRQFKYHPVEPE
jgi:hypothetical protein